MKKFRFRRFALSLLNFQLYAQLAKLFCCFPLFFFRLFLRVRKSEPSKKGARPGRLDTRTRSDILQSQGYPYEKYLVTTDDGYILELERLPRPQSNKAIYFQHGVLDSAFSWLAVTKQVASPAFRAYDLGYDVWAGTFRGCDRERRHANKDIGSRQFWNFTVNEHAWQDLPAFIAKIRSIKTQELRGNSTTMAKGTSTSKSVSPNAQPNEASKEPKMRTRNPVPPIIITTAPEASDTSTPATEATTSEKLNSPSIVQATTPITTDGKIPKPSTAEKEDGKSTGSGGVSGFPGESVGPLPPSVSPGGDIGGLKFTVTVISHSMGAMATLMYIVYWKMTHREHGITSAVLLSPAGFHKTTPMICKITGPILSFILYLFPFLVSFSLPNFIQIIAAKVVEDIRSSYTSRSLLSLFVYNVIGGTKNNHAFTKVHNLTYNIFAGVSTKIFKHFWQNWKSQQFQSYDYGKEKNEIIYGTSLPINFFDNYDKIDIPIYFAMGLRDTLIEPVSVLAHYETLLEKHPELAFIKAFPKLGHIDFTVGDNAEVSNWIFNTIGKFSKYKLQPQPATTRIKSTRRKNITE